MKEFFAKHGIWILLVAVIVTVTMAGLSAFGTGVAAPLQNAAGIVTAPFRAGIGAVTGWIDDRIRFADDYDALKEENKALKEENARLEAELRQAQDDRTENQYLREVLNLRPQERGLQLETAMVVDHTSSNWTRTLTLNKGSSMGLAPKDCVITAEGDLVGVVSEVGTNWATVLTVVDTDFEIGAKIFRSGEAAIAAGSFNLMPDGMLRLDYIADGTTLLNGDLIITSGLGGYYPPDLVIGTVEEVVVDDSGVTDYALLTPAVDYDELTEVFVVTDFTVVE